MDAAWPFARCLALGRRGRDLGQDLVRCRSPTFPTRRLRPPPPHGPLSVAQTVTGRRPLGKLCMPSAGMRVSAHPKRESPGATRGVLAQSQHPTRGKCRLSRTKRRCLFTCDAKEAPPARVGPRSPVAREGRRRRGGGGAQRLCLSRTPVRAWAWHITKWSRGRNTRHRDKLNFVIPHRCETGSIKISHRLTYRTRALMWSVLSILNFSCRDT